MRREPKRLIDGIQVPATAAPMYDAPASTYTTISAMTATNTSNAVVTLTIHLVPDEGAPSAANAVLWQRNLSPGESRVVSEAIAQTLHPRGAIHAVASDASAITLVASGYETVS